MSATPEASQAITSELQIDMAAPPATSLLGLQLKPHDGGTRLTLSDSLVGLVTPESARCQLEGWQALFGQGLKGHVEQG
ncbi:MAG: hypothetical protein DRQ55_03875 [Planctomycetota bacterium]|nr:MAG: hypothetical protein DRQ55_03875 [Planctomycetota bacterium]